MVNESRIDIYDYLYSLFYNVVTKNVYSMNEPQELSQSDTTDGFIVIRVGNINDESEFELQTYGWVRCYVEAYIPPTSRGRLDISRYRQFENAINDVIRQAMTNNDGTYWIQGDSVISMDSNEMDNPNNAYYMFVKSFIVNIEDKNESNQNDNVDNENGD